MRYPLVMANIAFEHGHGNSGFFHDGGSFQGYVSLPEGRDDNLTLEVSPKRIA